MNRHGNILSSIARNGLLIYVVVKRTQTIVLVEAYVVFLSILNTRKTVLIIILEIPLFYIVLYLRELCMYVQLSH